MRGRMRDGSSWQLTICNGACLWEQGWWLLRGAPFIWKYFWVRMGGFLTSYSVPMVCWFDDIWSVNDWGRRGDGSFWQLAVVPVGWEGGGCEGTIRGNCFLGGGFLINDDIEQVFILTLLICIHLREWLSHCGWYVPTRSVPAKLPNRPNLGPQFCLSSEGTPCKDSSVEILLSFNGKSVKELGIIWIQSSTIL